MEPPPILLIKINNYDKLDKYCVQIKLYRDPASAKSDICEFKSAIFNNGKTEEFLLFIRNFQMTLETARAIAAGSKIRYIGMLVCDETPHQLGTLSVEVVSTTSENLKPIILYLGTYFFLLMRCLKKSDAPWNEESARFKSKMLLCSHD